MHRQHDTGSEEKITWRWRDRENALSTQPERNSACCKAAIRTKQSNWMPEAGSTEMVLFMHEPVLLAGVRRDR